jgi:hypothetical protein
MPQISGAGSNSKADKQAAVNLPKKHAVCLISMLQISGAGSHSKDDKQAAVNLPKKHACSKSDQYATNKRGRKPQ